MVKHVPDAAANLALLDGDGSWRQVWTEAAAGLGAASTGGGDGSIPPARLLQDLAPNGERGGRDHAATLRMANFRRAGEERNDRVGEAASQSQSQAA